MVVLQSCTETSMCTCVRIHTYSVFGKWFLFSKHYSYHYYYYCYYYHIIIISSSSSIIIIIRSIIVIIIISSSSISIIVISSSIIITITINIIIIIINIIIIILGRVFILPRPCKLLHYVMYQYHPWSFSYSIIPCKKISRLLAIFSDAFSWMKNVVFWFKFNWRFIKWTIT